MSGREIILGVSGGIAAYKSAALASKLVQDGSLVTVVMTDAASKFIGDATFAALTGRPVYQDMFGLDQHPLGPHIQLAREAHLLCVAPATANFLAKSAQGLADDLLSTLYLSFAGPVIVAPAMNCEMWDKPVVQRNVQQLRDDGATIIDPEDGWLSCRQRGMGRMAAPESIARSIYKTLESV
jgi:phosphopantothenoylcysteine decarboxylase